MKGTEHKEPPKSPQTIAIVGNGASGTFVCAQLLKDAAERELRIEWIGAREPFGSGLPYLTRDPDHKLNVRASGMSAFPDSPLHFFSWAKLRAPGLEPLSFASRGLYGEYLESLVSKEDPRVRRHLGEAVALEQEGGRYVLLLRDGRRLAADQVVLAAGILPGKPAFGADSPAQAAALPENARVLVIGTGLTMVDVALTLCRRPGQKPVSAISKHGLLPQAHKGYTAHSPSPAFAHWLDSPASGLRECVQVFRNECAIAQKSGSDWRAVFDLVRPHTGRIWQRLLEASRRRFLRHVVRHWDVHRHRMAPEIAEKIRAYREEGRLVVESGRIRKLERTPAGWKVLRIAASGEERHEEFDSVLDCTGLTWQIRETSSPLVRNLIEKGFLSVDNPPLGAHPSGRHPRFHVLGPLLRGNLWESIAVPELRVQAQEIALRILDEKPIAPGKETRRPEARLGDLYPEEPHH